MLDTILIFCAGALVGAFRPSYVHMAVDKAKAIYQKVAVATNSDTRKPPTPPAKDGNEPQP